MIDSTPTPNAVTRLEKLDQNVGCTLGLAADMLLMLNKGISALEQVTVVVGTVVGASYSKEVSKYSRRRDPPKGLVFLIAVTKSNRIQLLLQLSLWSTRIQSSLQDTSASPVITEHLSASLILCTGSSPSVMNLSLPHNFAYHKLDLDTALSLSQLADTLAKERRNMTIGVIGSSHSAITVLMNLWHIAAGSSTIITAMASTEATGTPPPLPLTTDRPTTWPLRVKWFSRRPIVYATHLPNGSIMHDNTGLKGVAAAFAKQHLKDEALQKSPVGSIVEKINVTAGNEREGYQWHLPSCTHLVQAVGFVRDPLPSLDRDGETLTDTVGSSSSGSGDGAEDGNGIGLEYDHQTGGFRDGNGIKVRRLYGAGIAFPEMVRDPSGEVELAVGFWKFMKYLRNVVPEWET